MAAKRFIVVDAVYDGFKDGFVSEMRKLKGYYYPPTVLENVEPGQPAYDDELFGPVAPLIKAKDTARMPFE